MLKSGPEGIQGLHVMMAVQGGIGGLGIRVEGLGLLQHLRSSSDIISLLSKFAVNSLTNLIQQTPTWESTSVSL